jgi:hypothetical protein
MKFLHILKRKILYPYKVIVEQNLVNLILHILSLFVISVIRILLVFVILVALVQVKMDTKNGPIISCKTDNNSCFLFFFFFTSSEKDFDLCHSCFAIVKENHPEHIFVTRLVGTHASKGKKSKSSKCKKSKAQISPRQSPDNKVIPTVHHRGVECDNCDANIIGIRYKVRITVETCLKYVFN